MVHDAYSARLYTKLEELEWCSGECTSLPPMWPGFNSRHIWVEFVVGSRPCSERFFSGYSSFPSSTKTNIPKFQLDLETVHERATLLKPLKFPAIFYLFYTHRVKQIENK